MAPSPMADFRLKSYEISLVRPADPQFSHNHNHVEYFLSNLDQAVPGIVKTAYCFKPSPQTKNPNRPAEVIRDALKKVLTFYYPLAGRLRANAEGRMYLHCAGQGAVFVEAHADCPLADVGLDMTDPDFSLLKRLVHSIPGADSNILLMPPMVAQVTTFKCGGFVLGLAMNHVLYDGFSSMQFLNSWAEIARGVALSVPPFLDRALLRARSPLGIEFPHLEYSTIEDVGPSKEIPEEVQHQYQYRYFPFGPMDVDKLKKLAMQDGTLPTCTTFQVLSAHIWKCRTRALRVPPNQRVKLLFVMDVRRRLEPPLPKGYFGNAIYSAYSICGAGELLEKGLSFGVGLIQKAIERVTNGYLRSAIDYLEVTRKELPVKNSTEITTWSRIPFSRIDFGWGEPVQNGPASPPPHKDFVIFLSRGHDKTMDVLMGLPPRSMTLFCEYARV